MPYSVLPRSSFLDLTGYKVTTKTAIPDAYQLSAGQWHHIQGELPAKLNVAIVLDRANSPAELLGKSWGSRYSELQELKANLSLWSTYGAIPSDYYAALSVLRDELGLRILDIDNSAYRSSPDSRTIWIELCTADDFHKLFNTRPLLMNGKSTYDQDQLFWNGNLSIDERIQLSGIWFDYEFIFTPVPEDFSVGAPQYIPAKGPLSIGNDAAQPYRINPATIAQFYQFPLINTPELLSGTTIGFIQPTIGESVNSTVIDKDLQQLLQAFAPSFTGEIVQVGNSKFSSGPAEERDLDVSISASINPTTNLRLYSGAIPASDTGIYQLSSTFGSLYAAAWDKDELRPSVISNSYNDAYFLAPGSPFLRAYQQLFEDLALQGVTLISASGDHGSNADTPISANIGSEVSLGNGLANVQQFNANPYGLAVGGTSLSRKKEAQLDPTLASDEALSAVRGSIVEAAMVNDRSALWQLLQGGLKYLWSELGDNQIFLETVWNQYVMGTHQIQGFLNSVATAGGVDPTQPIPIYQQDYGLTPFTDAKLPELGRGMPDVSAAAGGNLSYKFINSNSMEPKVGGSGTSAAAPVWASLMHQISVILNNQEPSFSGLGYSNDLLYAASAVAPAAFNDITLGEITSSLYVNDQGLFFDNVAGTNLELRFTPKPFGYKAAEGYDLASGLGTPNGLLLSRAISSLVHAELSALDIPDVLNQIDHGIWISPARQNLLFQPIAQANGSWQVKFDETTLSGGADVADPYGWTSRLAQQSLQQDFSSGLSILFDGQSLGHVYQGEVAAGSRLDLSHDQTSGEAMRAPLTAPYGFIDFAFDNSLLQADVPPSSMQVARPVAIAITAGNQNNQEAIVRLRQVGVNDLSLRLYRVDDLTGMINGVAPGDTAYEHEVFSRLYQTVGGATAISGGGYGNYSEDRIQGVNNGDLIAMSLQTSEGNTFYSFSKANEQVDGLYVAHVRNFGLNTWGWEDLYGGGDLDFNDLVVELDFTSSAGSEILV